MTVIIQPYTEEFTKSVAEFNRRVGPANVPFQVPETPVAPWLPKVTDRKIYQEIFLAVEDSCVRGAYTFKHQEFFVGGWLREIGMCRMPISEGIVDKRYSKVGVMLVSDAIRRQPLLYGLGIGSFDAVITRMVQAMGFRVRVVPFFFKVRNGFQFLRNIQFLKTTRFRQLLFDAAAYSGFGWAGARIADVLLTRNGHHADVSAEQVGEFSAWADEVWERCKNAYSMVAVRDASVLNILYPSEDRRFIRLKIIEGQRVAGWAVLLDTAMSGSNYFGNMRVGSIVDCLALPEDANKVMAVATRLLEKRGVDLLLSNQNHPGWSRALKMAGFVEAPSNFLFVTSKSLTKLLDEIDPKGKAIHLNRGDGDGPIHL